MDWPERARIARERLTKRLAREGHPFAEFASCLIVARGARGMSVEAFAALAGVSPEMLAALESGECSPVEAPDRLVDLADQAPPEPDFAVSL